jgi:hypothetical protein
LPMSVRGAAAAAAASSSDAQLLLQFKAGIVELGASRMVRCHLLQPWLQRGCSVSPGPLALWRDQTVHTREPRSPQFSLPCSQFS